MKSDMLPVIAHVAPILLAMQGVSLPNSVRAVFTASVYNTMWNQKIRPIAPDKVLSFPLPGFFGWYLGIGSEAFRQFWAIAQTSVCATNRQPPAFAGIRALRKGIALVV